jgi:hypothetical protein
MKCDDYPCVGLFNVEDGSNSIVVTFHAADKAAPPLDAIALVKALFGEMFKNMGGLEARFLKCEQCAEAVLEVSEPIPLPVIESVVMKPGDIPHDNLN